MRTYFESRDLEATYNSRGQTTVEVLSFLTHRYWDDERIQGYLLALRPSSVRVIRWGTGVKMDARLWRVTVYLDQDDLVSRIEQEVEVGLAEDVENGHDLDELYGNH